MFFGFLAHIQILPAVKCFDLVSLLITRTCILVQYPADVMWIAYVIFWYSALGTSTASRGYSRALWRPEAIAHYLDVKRKSGPTGYGNPHKARILVLTTPCSAALTVLIYYTPLQSILPACIP
jgi:hypothetical protein